MTNNETNALKQAFKNTMIEALKFIAPPLLLIIGLSVILGMICFMIETKYGFLIVATTIGAICFIRNFLVNYNEELKKYDHMEHEKTKGSHL